MDFQEFKLVEGTKFRPNLDSSFKTGLYLKDKILGIGTLTYYDPENNNYGALGHEIIDSDTNKIFDDLKLGDSVAVNGVCLTVSELAPP